MLLNHPVSEQLFNCSEHYASVPRQFAPQTPNPDPTPSPSGPPRGSRLAHRALSALRQARLPLRLRPRSRSQILFVGQLPQWPPATPIPLSAAVPSGASLVKKLSARARSVGTDLRHQPRILTPPGESLSDAVPGGPADRPSAGGSSGRHHAPGLPSGWPTFPSASCAGEHCV